LYGTFSGSQAAVGTINDNLSLFFSRCILVRFTVGYVSLLSISVPLILSLGFVTTREKDGKRRSEMKREKERVREKRSLSIKIDAREA